MVNQLAQEIQKRRDEYYAKKARVSRQVCPRASSITSCAREMVLSIKHWDKKTPPDTYLMQRFQEGNDQERKVIRDLMDIGFEVSQGQIPFEIKGRGYRVIITGHIDGKLRWAGKDIPFEVKSLNPNIWNQIETADDLNKWDWTRKYLRQMQIYLYGNNEEEGLFIITDCLGHWKFLPVTFDCLQMEAILCRCEEVMDYVEGKNETPGELPEFCDDQSICRKCWAFGSLCQPPINFGEGLQVIDNEDMEETLKRREKLKETSKEYIGLDKEVKAYFKEKSHCICGNFEIIGKPGIMIKKAQEAKEIPTWTVKVIPILDSQEERKEA